MTYTPDSWTLIKITGTDPHYRVFASWSGGYLDGDSWKMNSGITEIREDDDYYYFDGFSGSVYQCHKKGYGIRSPHNQSVARSYEEKADGNLEIMVEMPENIMDFDWIINKN